MKKSLRLNDIKELYKYIDGHIDDIEKDWDNALDLYKVNYIAIYGKLFDYEIHINNKKVVYCPKSKRKQL